MSRYLWGCKALFFLLFVPSFLGAQQLRTGDLIFRQGEGIFSEIARDFSTHDKRFSHVGIVWVDANVTWVVHALQEPDKGFDGVVKEPIEGFLHGIKSYAFYRIEGIDEAKLLAQLKAQLSQPLPFDTRFSLESSDALYCTELVDRIFAPLGIRVPRTHRWERDFIAIEDVLRVAKPLP
ncbi:MAG: hypothetical protein KU37_07515 [Sulfuricurvum sp. PC08-66]|nr:MAG: hypothetical protein KU37_07515 [Sulfuricurvum sp. PC08-66]